MRHLHPLFESLGLEYDRDNRERVDSAIRAVLGISDEAGCPEVWSAVKAMSADDSAALPVRTVEMLRQALRPGTGRG